MYRHGIGVGGRDLSDEVGGLATLDAIELLAADPQVARIVLLSKPPGAGTAERVFERLAGSGKPAVACVFGLDPAAVPAGITAVATLKAAAEAAAGATLAPEATDAAAIESLLEGMASGRRTLRGLYCGGRGAY